MFGTTEITKLVSNPSGTTCDAICQAVLPCVALVRLLECLNFCSKIPNKLDKSHIKKLAVVFSLSDNTTQYPPTTEATTSIVSTIVLPEFTSKSTSESKYEERRKSITCGKSSSNGILTQKPQGRVGETSVYQCAFGYDFCNRTGSHPEVTCQTSGQWSDPPRPCHQSRWDSFVRGQSVYLAFTCSVQTNADIFIRAFLAKSNARFDVCLEGKAGLLTHHFTLNENNLIVVKSMDITNSWIQLTKKNFLFRSRSHKRFDVCLKHRGSSMQLRFDGKQLVTYNISENYDVTRLLIRGDISVHVVSVIRS